MFLTITLGIKGSPKLQLAISTIAMISLLLNWLWVPNGFPSHRAPLAQGKKERGGPQFPCQNNKARTCSCHWMERSWRCRFATDRSRESCDPWAREGNVQHTNRNAHAQGSTSLWIINIIIRAASYLLL